MSGRTRRMVVGYDGPAQAGHGVSLLNGTGIGPGTDRAGSAAGSATRAVSWRFMALATVGIFALITAFNVSLRLIPDVYGV